MPTVERMPQMHLVLGCDLGSADVLADYVARLSGNVRVIGNDHALVRALTQRGLDAVVLDEVMPIDSPQDLAAYDNAHSFLGELARSLERVCYRGISLFGPVANSTFNTLVLLEKASRLLCDLERSHAHAVFAVSAYAYNYLALWDLAQREGRIAPEDLCGRIRGGRLSPWIDYPDALIDSRVAAGVRDDGIGFFDLLAARRRDRSRTTRPRSPTTTRSRTTVLFFVNGNEYVLYLKPIFPILREFEKRSLSFSVLTVTRSTAEAFARNGVALRLLEDLEDDAGDPPELRLAHADALRRLRLALEGYAHVYADSYPIGAAVLRYCAGDYFQRSAIEHLRLIDLLLDTLRHDRPRCVMVSPDTIPTAHTTIAVAHRLGLAAVTTLAASVSPLSRHLGLYFADLIAVAGQDDLNAFIEAGYARKRVVITGSPMFDEISRASADEDRAYVGKRLPVDPAKQTLVVAASRVDPREAEWIRELGRAARRRGDLQVVVKGHPNYPLSQYADAMELCSGLPVHFVRDIDIHRLLNISAAVVTDYSHAGREALLFGKPLIVVNLTGTAYPANRFDELGVALLVTDLSGVCDAVDRVLDDRDLLARFAKARAEVVVPRYNHLNDGRAAERIVDILVGGAVATA